MDNCLPDWNIEFEMEPPFSNQRKPLGGENGLMEILWQNGDVVLQSQTHKKPKNDPIMMKSRQVYSRNDQFTSKSNLNQSTLIQEDETVTWLDCPIDEFLEKEFYTNFFSEIPPDPNNNKPSVQLQGNNDDNNNNNNQNHNNVFPTSDMPPLPRFESFTSSYQQTNLPNLKNKFPMPEIRECSALGSSRCGSNQVVNDIDNSSCGIGSRTLSTDVEKNYGKGKVSSLSKSTEIETLDQPITSSSGGSGSSSLWKTSNQSFESNRFKRKSREMEESECQSDATELESAAANQSSKKSGASRRSRVAEVHNLSERRRRDRINEKMKALQELIPHSTKTDKASMLEEVIEYMKSLQLQLQLMWMGGGMAPMMIPQHYMARMGIGIGPQVLQLQNLIRMQRFPLVDQPMTIPPNPNQPTISQSPVLNPATYQNQIQNPNFSEHFANYMGFNPMQTPSQPISMFNFGSQTPQKNQASSGPQSNSN